ncbi:hypothetical protein [Erwinia oleae]|uniref:hypothetical protein n=1 Tax=Erwinia oleae TaxID=796334 RepID=UPI0005528E7B|nr:hypothetical protein [Erwinia oleae]
MPPTIPPALSPSARALQHSAVEQSHTNATESAARPHGYSSDNEVAIHNQLNTFYEKHTSGGNREEMTAMIESRTKRLHEMGETPSSIEAALSQASRSDKKTEGAESARKALPHAVDLLFKKPSAATALMKGEGKTAGLLHQSAGEALKNRFYLQARPEDLEPVMAEATQKGRDNADAAKNIAHTAFDVASSNPKIQSAVANGAKRLGQTAMMSKTPQGVLAGVAIMGGIGLATGASHLMKKSTSQSGPAFLFAKKDWETQFVKLKGKAEAQPTSASQKTTPHAPPQTPSTPDTSLQGKIREAMQSMVFSYVNNISGNVSLAISTLNQGLDSLHKATKPTSDNAFSSGVKETLQRVTGRTDAPLSKAAHMAQQLQQRLA